MYMLYFQDNSIVYKQFFYVNATMIMINMMMMTVFELFYALGLYCSTRSNRASE